MIERNGILFQHFLTSANEGNAFIVACATTREALLVDAGCFDPIIPDFIEKQELKLKALFLTHNHYDHTDGAKDVVQQYDVTVYGGQAKMGGVPVQVVAHGDTITVGEISGKVLETTGHTPDGRSLYFPGMVFTGDALFAGSVGGTSSDALYQQQLDLIRKHIFSLPGDTEIHTGHGPSSTVAIEKKYNPFFNPV